MDESDFRLQGAKTIKMMNIFIIVPQLEIIDSYYSQFCCQNLTFMIRPGLNLEPHLRKGQQSHQYYTNREDLSFRVNWLTQKSQRQAVGKDAYSSNQQQYLFENKIKHLKICLQKEVTLGISNQNKDACYAHNNHLLQQQSCQSAGNNSQKNSCEKRQKLSLISKRPSLRKINNFISFKEDAVSGQNRIEPSKQRQQPQPSVKQSNSEAKKQRKKCIRISARRQCLAQISKN